MMINNTSTSNVYSLNIQYVDVDSTYRDRTRYPNPSEFQIPISTTGNKTTGITSISPVSDSVPLFPDFSIPALAFYEENLQNPPIPLGTSVERSYLPYMFSVASMGGNTTFVYLDSLPISPISPNSSVISPNTANGSSVSYVYDPENSSGNYIGKILENVDTGEYRIITDFTYSDTPLKIQCGVIDTHSVNTEFHSEIIMDMTPTDCAVPSNVDRFYVGKTLKYGVDTYTIINSYTNASGETVLELDSVMIPVPSASDLFDIIAEEGWYATINTAWASSLSTYPAYRAPLPAGTSAGSQYRIREGIPRLSQASGAIVGGSASTIQLPNTASSQNGSYVGDFIWVYNANILNIPSSYTAFNDVRMITAYDGATRTATVSQSFSANIQTASIIDGNTLNWEILPFSRDQYTPITINTNSTTTQQQSVCYEIDLISLVLPNTTLKSGDRIACYPYVLVKFYNINSHNLNRINSNNPHANTALFKVPIDNIDEKKSAKFVSLNIGICMNQVIKFKMNDSFYFSVYLPDGSPFETVESDTVSPEPANPDIQISAIFKLIRL